MNWNWLFRWLIIGPIVRAIFWTRVTGLKKLPKRIGFILVIGPHKSHEETVFLPVFLARRELHFLVKGKYWDYPIIGWFLRLTHQIKVGGGAYKPSVADLRNDHVVAIFPEGTRHPGDAAVHKGNPGAVRMARDAGVPIYTATLSNLQGWRPFWLGHRRIHIDGPYMVSPRMNDETEPHWAFNQIEWLMKHIAARANVPYVD